MSILRTFFVLLLVLLHALPANATTTTSADCFFDWAETAYSQYFASAHPPSQTFDVYYYRHYSDTNAYLGVANDTQHAVYVGPASGGGLLDLGNLSTWLGNAGCPATLPATAQVAGTCTALDGTKINDVTITSTKWFEASGINPSFCQVKGTRAPYLDIEVDVPDNWSGRLWQQGGGSLDGKIPSAITSDATGAIIDVNIALKTGNSVYAASNGGNRSSVPTEAAPLVWANGTADGVASARDYAYEATNTTREFAKAVTKAFYGKLPDHSYFNGCSNGGRNAYIAADRWPQEYDGIVAGCMGMDIAGQTVAWLNLGSRAETSAMPSVAQWQSVTTAAVLACDSLDGVADGIIANQSACQFDVAALQCGQPGAAADPSICLTPAQVQTVKDVTADVKLADGTTVYSGFNWVDWAARIEAWGFLGGGNAILATGDPLWSTPAKQQSFALDHDYALFQYGFRTAGASPDNSKVAAFVASGKKLISWHDGADNLLSINDHLRNYATMTDTAKKLGLTNPSTNTRFFVVPGGTHAQGQVLTEVNWFNAITDWVEKGTAPEQLVYNRKDAITGAVRTLPVCRHPQYPRYNGAGDVNSAGNYTCTNPYNLLSINDHLQGSSSGPGLLQGNWGGIQSDDPSATNFNINGNIVHKKGSKNFNGTISINEDKFDVVGSVENSTIQMTLSNATSTIQYNGKYVVGRISGTFTRSTSGAATVKTGSFGLIKFLTVPSAISMGPWLLYTQDNATSTSNMTIRIGIDPSASATVRVTDTTNDKTYGHFAMRKTVTLGSEQIGDQDILQYDFKGLPSNRLFGYTVSVTTKSGVVSDVDASFRTALSWEDIRNEDVTKQVFYSFGDNRRKFGSDTDHLPVVEENFIKSSGLSTDANAQTFLAHNGDATTMGRHIDVMNPATFFRHYGWAVEWLRSSNESSDAKENDLRYHTWLRASVPTYMSAGNHEGKDNTVDGGQSLGIHALHYTHPDFESYGKLMAGVYNSPDKDHVTLNNPSIFENLFSSDKTPYDSYTYMADYGGIRLIVLNTYNCYTATDADTIKDKIKTWIAGAFDGPIILLLHPSPCGNHNDEIGYYWNGIEKLKADIQPLIANKKNVIVISGHVHETARTEFQGVNYYVLGTGGADDMPGSDNDANLMSPFSSKLKTPFLDYAYGKFTVDYKARTITAEIIGAHTGTGGLIANGGVVDTHTWKY